MVEYIDSKVNGATCCPLYRCIPKIDRNQLCPYIPTHGEPETCPEGFSLIREYFEVQNGVVCEGKADCFPTVETEDSVAEAAAVDSGTAEALISDAEERKSKNICFSKLEKEN